MEIKILTQSGKIAIKNVKILHVSDAPSKEELNKKDSSSSNSINADKNYFSPIDAESKMQLEWLKALFANIQGKIPGGKPGMRTNGQPGGRRDYSTLHKNAITCNNNVEVLPPKPLTVKLVPSSPLNIISSKNDIKILEKNDVKKAPKIVGETRHYPPANKE